MRDGIDRKLMLLELRGKYSSYLVCNCQWTGNKPTGKNKLEAGKKGKAIMARLMINALFLAIKAVMIK